MKKTTLLILAMLALVALAGLLPRSNVSAAAWQTKVDPWVMDATATGQAEFLVFLTEQADVSAAASMQTKLEKGTYVYETLSATAARTQGPVLAELARLGVDHQAYWVANMVWVRGDAAVVQTLAQRPDVARISANPSVHLDEVDVQAPSAETPTAIEWNITKVGAPSVWALGDTGQGTVIGGQDTGYDWDHPALINQYRGWNGASANHNYNWHDSIHSGGGGVCGVNATAPCDDNNHGTHTMGTMVGSDNYQNPASATNAIGMAPGARWIGCRNMNQGNGTPTTYSECFQWFIAPTDLSGNNPDPAQAPHVINNSWGCPPSEGCTDPLILQTVVDNTRAAGIVVVVSAGNAGSACSTVADPAAIYASSFSVGSTTSTDAISSFSSRGPVTIDGSNRLKPNISAPGSSIRSSIPGTGYQGGWNGTSMAGPHVAGLVGLLISANPALAGNVSGLEDIIETSAVHLQTTQTCGGTNGQIPNNVFGYGRIDALAAYNAAISGGPTPTPGPTATPTATPTPTSAPGNTGLLSPSANAPVTTGSGDNNGFQTNPANAYGNDASVAVDTDSGSGTQTSCTSNRKDRHTYYNYNISVPGGATINGIEVRLDGKADSVTGAPKFCVQISWDGGVSWTTALSSATLTTTEATYVLGGPTNNWGRAWATGELTNANFRIRIVNVASNTSRDFTLDYIAVNVYYTP